MTKSTMGTKLPRKLGQKMQIVGEQIRLARLRDQAGQTAQESQYRADCRTRHLFASYGFTHRERRTDCGDRYLSQGALCASAG